MPRLDILMEVKTDPRITKGWLRAVAQRALLSRAAAPAHLSLIIADDPRLRELKRVYFGTDETTDVVAFPMSAGEPVPASPRRLPWLGEIIISWPQAVRQAQELGHPVQQELALLVIHGLLHLLGYNDTQPAQQAAMRAEEERLLAQVRDLI